MRVACDALADGRVAVHALAWAVVSLLVGFRTGRWIGWAGMAMQVGVSMALWLAVARDGGFYYGLGAGRRPWESSCRWMGWR